MGFDSPFRMRSFFLAVDDRQLDGMESGPAQQIDQFDLRKAEPNVGIKLAGFLEASLLVLFEREADRLSVFGRIGPGSRHGSG